MKRYMLGVTRMYDKGGLCNVESKEIKMETSKMDGKSAQMIVGKMSKDSK